MLFPITMPLFRRKKETEHNRPETTYDGGTLFVDCRKVRRFFIGMRKHMREVPRRMHSGQHDTVATYIEKRERYGIFGKCDIDPERHFEDKFDDTFIILGETPRKMQDLSNFDTEECEGRMGCIPGTEIRYDEARSGALPSEQGGVRGMPLENRRFYRTGREPVLRSED
jgi:hypothetical protein